MVAAINWTVILASAATGATAIIVAGIGYLGNRLATSAATSQIEAEGGRFQAELQEERRRQRQDLYRELMVSERRIAIRLNEQEPLNDLSEDFRIMLGHVHTVILVGPKEVAAQALAFTRAVRSVRVAVRREGYGAATRAASFQWNSSRRSMIDAMRMDVAADAARIENWDEVGAVADELDPVETAAEELEPLAEAEEFEPLEEE
jgi:hypothetical protein